MELTLRPESRVGPLEVLLFPFARELPVLEAADPSPRETMNEVSMSSGNQDAGLCRGVSAADLQDLQR